MLNRKSAIFLEAVKHFLDSPSFEAVFPLGGKTSIPTCAELNLLEKLSAVLPTASEAILELRNKLDTTDAYHLVLFSLRMAVYAARINSVDVLRASTFALIIDDNVVDYRDILIGLSIVEDCASRLGVNLALATKDSIEIAASERRKIIHGYLLRPAEMRGLRVMGIAVSGIGDTLEYKKI